MTMDSSVIHLLLVEDNAADAVLFMFDPLRIEVIHDLLRNKLPRQLESGGDPVAVAERGTGAGALLVSTLSWAVAATRVKAERARRRNRDLADLYALTTISLKVPGRVRPERAGCTAGGAARRASRP